MSSSSRGATGGRGRARVRDERVAKLALYLNDALRTLQAREFFRGAARMAAGKKVWFMNGSLGLVGASRCCLSQHSPRMCRWMSYAKHWSGTSAEPGQKDHMLHAGPRPHTCRGLSGHHCTPTEPGWPQTRAWA